MWKRKVLSVFIAVVLLLSFLPVSVLATEISGELGGTLRFEGKAEVGSILSADFEKVTPEGLTEEYVSFLWSREVGEELTEVGTESTYEVAPEDLDAKIVLEITGLEEKGVTGTLKAESVAIALEGQGVDASPSEEEETEGVGDLLLEEEELTVEESAEEEELAVEEPAEEEPMVDVDPWVEEVQTENIEPDPEESSISQELTEDNAEDENWDMVYLPEEGESAVTFSAEASTEDSTGILDFGTIRAGEQDSVEQQYVYVKNTGTGSLNFEIIHPEHFMVQDIKDTLEPGDGVSLWVEPREGLASGTYEDTIVFTAKEGASASFKTVVTVSDAQEIAETLYSISAEPSSLLFKELTEGYENPEESQTVVVSNDGSTEATLLLPEGNYFQIVSQEDVGDEIPLAPGASCSLLVVPREGLTPGEYMDELNFAIKEDSNIQEKVTAGVAVKKEEPVTIKVKADPETISFDTVTEGYKNPPEAKKVTLTNTGTGEVTLLKPSGKNFQIGDLSKETLAPGEKTDFTVRPVENLAVGEYKEEIAIKSAKDSSFLAAFSVSFKVDEEKLTYSFSVNPDMVDFGSLESGYQKLPDEQRVSVTNTGTGVITLGQPVSDYFNVSILAPVILKPGESTSFTIQPKTGLTQSEYLEVIEIPNDADLPALLNAYFHVTKRTNKLEAVQSFKDIQGLKNGTEKSAAGLKLPSKGLIRTTEGKMKADVRWDVEECPYNPKSSEKQNFTVHGTVILPSGVSNPDNVSQNVAVKVEVNAYVPQIASPEDNLITGISSDGYTTASKITFTAVGAGMDNQNPRKGDVRYVPYSWTILNENVWKSAPYTAAFGLSQKGNYTLKVNYIQQKFSGKNWENTGETDVKQVAFAVAAASPTPTPASKAIVRTGDDTNIWIFAVCLVLAASCVVTVIVIKRKGK